jgi:hypothetical protein
MDIHNMFSCKCKSLWSLKVVDIEKNAHVFIFEIHYNKTTMGTILKLNTKKLVYYTQKKARLFL